MNIKSLTLKNRLTDDKTGEQYLDLTAPSFKYIAEQGVKALHYVTQDRQVGLIKYQIGILALENILMQYA